MNHRNAVVLLAGLALVACTAKLSSTASINGTAFMPASCRSGQAAGFSGVDLIDATGLKVRLVMRPDGRSNALLFPSGAAVGTDLGVCGVFSLQQQSSRINNVYNVRGSATLQCTNGAQTLSGAVGFENCH